MSFRQPNRVNVGSRHGGGFERRSQHDRAPVGYHHHPGGGGMNSQRGVCVEPSQRRLPPPNHYHSRSGSRSRGGVEPNHRHMVAIGYHYPGGDGMERESRRHVDINPYFQGNPHDNVAAVRSGTGPPLADFRGGEGGIRPYPVVRDTAGFPQVQATGRPHNTAVVLCNMCWGGITRTGGAMYYKCGCLFCHGCASHFENSVVCPLCNKTLRVSDLLRDDFPFAEMEGRVLRDLKHIIKETSFILTLYEQKIERQTLAAKEEQVLRCAEESRLRARIRELEEKKYFLEEQLNLQGTERRKRRITDRYEG